MSEETGATTLRVGGWLSIGLGPVLSKSVPMASDLRPWAFWLSGIVSLVTASWLAFWFAKNPTKAGRAFTILCVGIVFFALAHIAINLLWTVETGDVRDVVWQIGLIATFALAVGCTTGAIVAAANAVKKSTG
jgi:hypothetical protein